MAGSGIVVFEKSWEKGKGVQRDLANQWGGLVRAIIEFSNQSVGLPMSYLEAGDAALSVATDPKTKIICTLFHSADDSAPFGSLLAREILKTFQECFATVDFTKVIRDKGQFAGFGSKIIDCIKNVLGSVLTNLSSRPGIDATLLVYDDGTDSISKGSLQDKISVIANYKAFLASANQTMHLKKDTPSFMSLITNEHIIYIHRVSSKASMLTLCQRKYSKTSYYGHVSQSHDLLRRVFRLLSFYT